MIQFEKEMTQLHEFHSQWTNKLDLEIIQELHKAAKWLQFNWNLMNKIEVKI